jgi:hypothetical protein
LMMVGMGKEGHTTCSARYIGIGEGLGHWRAYWV